MSAPKRAQEDIKRSDEETQDEIEQIMSEIEQLQKEIGSSEPSEMAQPSSQAHPQAHQKKRSEERPKPQLVKSEPVTDGPEIESSFTESDPLEEFRAGGGGDGGMEDTIGHIHGEESSGGALGEIEPEMGDQEPRPRDEEIPESARETREAIARASREVEEAFENDTHEIEEEEHGMHDHDAGKGGAGALTMTLKGNMTLRLQYEIEGQMVTIGFADHALKVQLADGTEFKIPMRHRAPVRRTA